MAAVASPLQNLSLYPATAGFSQEAHEATAPACVAMLLSRHRAGRETRGSHKGAACSSRASRRGASRCRATPSPAAVVTRGEGDALPNPSACQLAASEDDSYRIASTDADAKQATDETAESPFASGSRAAKAFVGWMKGRSAVSSDREGNAAIEKLSSEPAPETSEEIVATREETELYEIKRKEWVAAIANKLGVQLKVLRRLNPGVDLDRVKPKQKIVVPRGLVEPALDSCQLLQCPTSSPPVSAENNTSAEQCSMPSSPSALSEKRSVSAAVDTCSVPPKEFPAVDVCDVAKKGGTELGGIVRAKPTSVNERTGGDASNATTYVLKRGDRISSIAKDWGVTRSELQALNPEVDLGKVKAGQALMLPLLRNREGPSLREEKQLRQKCENLGELAARKNSREAVPAAATLEQGGFREYTIRSGDYLYEIAEEFGVDVGDLIEVNSLSENQPIKVGQVVTIPPRKESMAPEVFQTSQGVRALLSPGMSLSTFRGLLLMAGVISLAVGGTLVKMKHSRKESQKVVAGQTSIKKSVGDKNGKASSISVVQKGQTRRGQESTNMKRGWGQEHFQSIPLQERVPGLQPFAPREDDGAFPSAVGMEEVMNFASFAREPDATGEVAGAHGFAVRSSLPVALSEAAKLAAAGLVMGPSTLALVAVGSSAWRGSDDMELQDSEAEGGEGRTANNLEESIRMLLEELPTCTLHGLAPEWSLRRPEEISVAASGAVLLMQAKGGMFSAAASVEGVGVETAVRMAVEHLTMQVGSEQQLKAVVACVSQGQENEVLNLLALHFPSASLYSVSSQPGAAAPAWLVCVKKTPAVSLELGVSLIGLTREADIPGAYMATVVGQWLYRHRHLVVASAPRSAKL